MKSIITILISLLPVISVLAQNRSPLLTGTVNISITKGTFSCDLTLSDLPDVEDYFIRLNSGMNLLNIKSVADDDSLLYYEKSLVDTLSTGESAAYYFPGKNGKGKYLPSALRFKYVGKYPVVKDTARDYMLVDWKGNIAFNGYSVRTDGMQSCWYPVLYDVKNDKAFYKVRYDLTITCEDCTVLYLNGSPPVKLKSSNFKSQLPFELALFCGNYNFSGSKNTYFLNTDFSRDEMKRFSEVVDSFKNYYSEKLKIPYGGNTISFINTTPVSKKQSWLFVSFPSFISVGWDNKFRVIIDGSKLQNMYRAFLAHELAHYYFGTYKTFNSPLGYALLEGLAEYSSSLLTKNLIDRQVYEQIVLKKIKTLQNFNAVPISEISSEKDYKNTGVYAYVYVPVVFLAVEKEIGENKMWQWLSEIVRSGNVLTGYNFLVSTLKSVLQNDKLLKRIEEKYFKSENSLKNILDKINLE